MTADQFYMLVGAVAALIGVLTGSIIAYMLRHTKDKRYKEFAEFVAEEIFEETSYWNAETFKEIACRKLHKLGLVDKTDKYWIHKD